METAGIPQQVVVLATRLKGEVNCAPLTGVVTVMANAGMLVATRARRAEKKYFINLPQICKMRALMRSCR